MALVEGPEGNQCIWLRPVFTKDPHSGAVVSISFEFVSIELVDQCAEYIFEGATWDEVEHDSNYHSSQPLSLIHI